MTDDGPPDALDEYGHPERPVWASLPRLLYEQCEGGCGRMGCHVYACDLPNGVRLWCCKSCYPQQPLQRAAASLKTDPTR